ncbi:MAG: hypothetical protein Tsb0034_09310 [Ekhidna sp.]
MSIDNDRDFDGYDLLEIKDQRLFILAEHWHNIKSVPQASLKLLKYLYQNAGVRIFAIEQGKSSAYMINEYLKTGDTVMLQHITRNTMFWSKEHRDFFKQLREFNLSLPETERIEVRSIDIEYKMESAIFMINQFIGEPAVPANLKSTLGAFQVMYEETRAHREQYDGLSIMFYYDRAYVESLVMATINDLEENSDAYISFLGEDFTRFATMILEMDDGLTFDYTNPNNHYKFRDRLIYQNFVDLIKENPDKAILCPIGLRHATKRSSVYDLKHNPNSPVAGKVMNIRVSALFNKAINAGDLKKINFNYPDQLRKNSATLIRHDPSDLVLKSSKGFDYTLFINENGSLTPFDKVLTERY